MFGVEFVKASPTTYVLHFKNGRLKREGVGLSFYYFAHNSVIVAVPVSSVDVPFVFNEVTADFQSITVQGQLTYRVADPKRLATLLDFSTRNGRHTSADPEKLNERLVNVTQVLTSEVTQRMTLRQALISYQPLSAEVLAKLRASESVQMMGLEILGLSILKIAPTPEMAKALEAEAREELQRRSDEAIYARRNSAVEQERRIKESELNTEILVEEKRRQKRETQMAADIAVEQQRANLIEQKAANDRKQADTQAYALNAVLQPVRGVDWRTLQALTNGGLDARANIAMGFRELAENAQKIGEINITPDLLNSLMKDDAAPMQVVNEPPSKTPRR
jgi:regulator of protease activity HflC (stomatin/prohibitin superfamily)